MTKLEHVAVELRALYQELIITGREPTRDDFIRLLEAVHEIATETDK